jgi:hypothetical protein
MVLGEHGLGLSDDRPRRLLFGPAASARELNDTRRTPDVDEDISAEGMPSGIPANRPTTRRAKWPAANRRQPG